MESGCTTTQIRPGGILLLCAVLFVVTKHMPSQSISGTAISAQNAAQEWTVIKIKEAVEIVVLLFGVLLYFFVGELFFNIFCKFDKESENNPFGCLVSLWALFAWPVTVPVIAICYAAEKISAFIYKAIRGDKDG